MRVCVTGAAGFIGSHVVRELSQFAHVVGIDDLSTGSLSNLTDAPCTFIKGSILDPETLGSATEGVDAIVHLAALPSVPRSIVDPVACHDANATGTLRVLEAARSADNAHVIVASSSSVYGANPMLPKHESLVSQPMSPYAASKLATEQYALAWQHTYGLPVLAFRFFNVFGPRQAPGHAYAAVVPAFLYAALRGKPVTIHGDGTQSRDFTYVGTVALTIVEAIRRRVVSPTPVNLAFESRTSLLEVLALMERVLGFPIRRKHVEPRPGDVPHSQADSTCLRGLFPDVVSVQLEEGLLATADWMREFLNEGSRAGL